MIKIELERLITNAISKQKVVSLAKFINNNNIALLSLIDITFHEKQEVGFRAAWILENIYTISVDRFLPQAIYFLNRFHSQNNLSARRHFAKILALMTKKNAPQEIKSIISSYETNGLVETVFSWLIDDKVPVAIKSHCLNILANLNAKHNWIKDELLQTIDFLVDKESIAFYAKAKQIRKQLK